MTERWRVLITEPIHEAAAERLRQAADVRVLSRFYGAPDVSDETMAAELSTADLAIVRGANIPASAINSARRLRAIIVHGAGVDKIDVEAATARTISVVTTSSMSAESVAEFALSMIFCLAKHFIEADRRTRAGEFLTAKNDLGIRGIELRGKTLGIIGFGQVGRRVGVKAQALGLRVVVLSAHATPAELEAIGATKVDTLRALMEGSDVVSVHCALTQGTRGLIGKRELEWMKPSAFLVNTARGGIVDQPALVASLRSGCLAGAAVDVYAQEPPNVDDDLLHLPNLLLTPHIAGLTAESSRRLGMRCVDEALAWLNATSAPTTQ